MSSRYPIHKDWCHVSHDGPCLREDQPTPTAAEREGEHRYVTCDVTDCPGYHCAHVAKELADAAAALLAARRENETYRKALQTAWRRNTQSNYEIDAALAATPEGP